MIMGPDSASTQLPTVPAPVSSHESPVMIHGFMVDGGLLLQKNTLIQN